MISTFFGRDTLDSPHALVTALLIGIAFGFALERAGFGSSRRLAGIFYLRDMAVLKVMFTALVVCMLGLQGCLAAGWISVDQLYFMPSVFGAAAIAGLIFGVGFAVGGWCPGTAAVGAASGKVDALIFLGGAVLGSIIFNEAYRVVLPLYTWGSSGVRFAWQDLGVSQAVFAVALTVAAVGCFWGSEFIEKSRKRGGRHYNSPFLRAFSLMLVVLAAGVSILPSPAVAAGGVGSGGQAGTTSSTPPAVASENALLEAVETGADHIEPAELAEQLVNGDPDLLLVDVRLPEEFDAFHIRGAIHASLTELAAVLAPYKNRTRIVLYSNGMTHPAQARDALARMGYQDVYILTDGLRGFIDTCVRPVSLRAGPLPAADSAHIDTWRAYFLGTGGPAATSPKHAADTRGLNLPGLATTTWLADNLGHKGLVVLECRDQPAWSRGHIPGASRVSVEQFRGVVNGVPSMLLPAEVLAEHLSLMGIEPSDTVVIVPGEAMQDATLVAMVFERLGHRRYVILDGGFAKWTAEKRSIDTWLPEASPSQYPVAGSADTFTVGYDTVLQHVKTRSAVILDVRPGDYFTGKKSDEARGGHIPGAVSRPFSEDVVSSESGVQFRPIAELAKEYSSVLPSKESRIVVHCRTGHQASQTFLVLKRILGYTDVLWYDAGWTEWAARPELPIEAGPGGR